ncbi:NTPase [Anaerohalosphaera lusitana]|nr:NTPase [Anaerohalosphaera lusitana]
MNDKPFKILIEGPPGCGKTTAIKEITSELPGCAFSGFYTNEMREEGRRVGFTITNFADHSEVFAHQDFDTPTKVGRYSVDVQTFEKIALPAIDIDHTTAPLLIIDEIGKMECLSEPFQQLILKAFDSQRDIIATVPNKGTGLIQQIKKHPSVKITRLSKSNFNETIYQILKTLQVAY